MSSRPLSVGVQHWERKGKHEKGKKNNRVCFKCPIFAWDCNSVTWMTLRSKKKKRKKNGKRFLKLNIHKKQLLFYYCSSQKIVHSLACPQIGGASLTPELKNHSCTFKITTFPWHVGKILIKHLTLPWSIMSKLEALWLCVNKNFSAVSQTDLTIV